MTIAVIHRSAALQHVLELVVMHNGHQLADSAVADCIICHDIETILPYLQAGKTVVQFVTPVDRAAHGFATAPEFAGRFSIFSAVKHPEYGDVPEFLAWLRETEKGANS